MTEEWIEYGYKDPKSISWVKVSEALQVMGIDVSNGGDQFIELHIYERRVEIKRTRRSETGDVAMWTITKEIMIS